MGSEFAPPSASPPPPYVSPPPHPRRLMRSTRERMWAGVAGGLAEYFDVDPSLVRLLWVAATVITAGAAVPVYILAWIILPRDDRPSASSQYVWRDWSHEFHSETQRLAEEARRMADEVREAGQSWRGPGPTGPTESTTSQRTREAATDKGVPTASPTPPTEEPWWTSERYVERHRAHGRHPRSTGIVLVTLGVLLLAANAGVFSWIDWKHMWPLVFIGLGVLLLVKQTGWGR